MHIGALYFIFMRSIVDMPYFTTSYVTHFSKLWPTHAIDESLASGTGWSDALVGRFIISRPKLCSRESYIINVLLLESPMYVCVSRDFYLPE